VSTTTQQAADRKNAFDIWPVKVTDSRSCQSWQSRLCLDIPNVQCIHVECASRLDVCDVS